MKLKDVFDRSVQFLKERKFESPRLDIELLISHILKIERIEIYLKLDQPLSEDELQRCREALKRRSLGEPVAYIVGQKGFYKQDFLVGAGVLVPRPETELLVERALDFIKLKDIKSPRILDLGAGSGCIGFSILQNAENSTLVSIEKSAEAFHFLKKNFEVQKKSEHIILLNEDVEKIDLDLLKQFDVIVANPPYIDRKDPLVQDSVVRFEPEQALFADNEGLACVDAWFAKFTNSLKSPGIFLVEIGASQGPAVSKLAQKHRPEFKHQILKDLSGLDRVLESVR